jgi:hypothetical protein
MAEIRENAQTTSDVTSGKGRKDEVGRTGIYPASDPDAPADARPVAPGELGHTSPRQELAVAKDVELSEPRLRSEAEKA